MSSSQFNDVTIKEVMKEINRSYFVPDIQREYVWLSNPKEEKIETLFDSLLRGYPIGTFLIWKLKKNEMKTSEELKNIQLYKFVEKYDERKKHNERIDIEQIDSNDLYIILDGQQRLTSLYIGLIGSRTLRKKRGRANNQSAYEPKKLYINLKHIPNLEDADDKYEISFLSDKERADSKNGEHWFKIGDILDMSLIAIKNYVEKHELNDDAFGICSNMHSAFCSDYKISYFQETGDKLSKALNIFIRVNSGGRELSYSDLLMSILTATFKIDIRDMMNDFVDDLKARGFEVMNRDSVLKSCLLLTGSPHVFNLKNFSKENISKIENSWSEIQESIWVAVKLLSDYGYVNQLSSAYILGTIALFHYNKKTIDDEDKIQIMNFVKMAQIKRYFRDASDNKLDVISNNIKGCKSFLEFNKKMYTTDKNPLRITDDDIDGFVHLEYGDSETFPVLQTLYPALDYKSSVFDIDHIYPKSKFTNKNKLLDSSYLRRANELFNLQLLRRDINHEKKAKDPEIWLKEEYQTEDKIAQYKKGNYIKEDLPLEWNNIKEFEESRRDMLIEELKKKFALIQASFKS